MNKKDLQKVDIDGVLNSLNNLQRAEANPFFYTRLKARMDKQYRANGIAGISWLKPSLAFAVLTLLVVLNVVTIINKNRSAEEAGTSTDVTQQMAKDYDLGITTY